MGLPQRLRLAAIAILAVGAIFLLRDLPLTIGAHLVQTSTEGWDAFNASRVFGPEPLYPPADAMFSNNYPPLAFLLTALVGKLTGDEIVAGRILTLASFFFVVGAVMLIVRRLGASLPAALFAACWLLATEVALAGDPVRGNYIGSADPQWLGHAFSLAALLVYVGGKATPARRLAVVGLATAALLVKLLYLAIPAAIAAHILLYAPRTLPRWIVSSLIVGVVAALACLLTVGPSMIWAILSFEQARTYSTGKMLALLHAQLLPLAPALLAALLLLALGWRDRKAVLVLLYVAAAWPLAIFLGGGNGTWTNVYFEPAIALSLVAGLLLARLEHPPRAAACIGALLLLCWTPVAAFVRASPHVQQAHLGLPEKRIATDREIALLSATPGPVLCETLAFCYWAGKPQTIDTWSLGYRISKGMVPASHLTKLLDEGYFDVIQIESARAPLRADPISSPNLPQEVNAHFHNRYRMLRDSEVGGAILVRR